MKAMDLTNVFMDSEAKERINAYASRQTPPVQVTSVQAHPQLDEVIRTLATLKPTWRFCGGAATIARNEPLEYSLCSFAVLEDGEELGTVTRQYVGRSYHDYKIVVSNSRIMSGRRRGEGYTTDDPKKAITKIKRTFGRKSAKERLDEADTKARSYLGNAVSNHAHQHADAYRTVISTARDWVMGAGFEQFMAYVHESMPEQKRAELIASKVKGDHLKAEMSILNDIRNRLGSQKSALIVRDMDQYIVRVGDNVQLHDDNTLPVQLRGKLGMLKLVDKEHFVEGAGSRVTDEVFVVLVDEDIPNTVSEGENE